MSARQRQLGKQVSAPVFDWLVVCSPGTEALQVAELAALGQAAVVESLGAVLFQARLLQAWPIIRRLTIANRVYLRLAQFRAGAREELFRKTADIPWELWLAPDCGVEVRSVVRHSRLSHEGTSARTVEEAIVRRLAEGPWRAAGDDPRPGAAEARILLRVENNQVTLALDASGQGQYQRGFRSPAARAPLRESLAAAILRHAASDLDPARRLVVDPLCGSGTFGIEAMLWMGLGAAASGRHCTCEDWPGLSAASLDHERRLDARRLAALPAAGLSTRVLCSDLDSAAVAAANQSLAAAAAAWGLPWQPQASQADFFDLTAPDLPAGWRGLVCLNPPYGLRLAADTDSLYRALARHLATAWQGWRVVIICPDATLEGYFPTNCRRLAFRHGGLRMAALSWG